MEKFFAIFALTCLATTAICDHSTNGIRPSNVLGGAEQHASFSFVRPGLTQTSYSFNGPSSHQSFSSSIGNPHLAQRVLPNVAHALAYRNPGLGYFSTAPISTAYANSPYVNPSGVQLNSAHSSYPAAFSYHQQAPLDQATALAYINQYQNYQQNARETQAQLQQHQHQQEHQNNPEIVSYQAQLGQLLALRQQQAQLQLQANAQHQQQIQGQGSTRHVPVHEIAQQIPEQVQLQQQGQQQPSQNLLGVAYSSAPSVAHVKIPEQVQLQQQVQQQPSQNLLGVAYSSAPSVAHVKVTGNGYKFDF